jgi:hypothetical protein
LCWDRIVVVVVVVDLMPAKVEVAETSVTTTNVGAMMGRSAEP